MTTEAPSAARRAWAKALPFTVVLLAAGAAKPLGAGVWELFWFHWNLDFVSTCIFGPLLLVLCAAAAVALQKSRAFAGVVEWREGRDALIVLALTLVPSMAVWGYGSDHLQGHVARHRAAFDAIAAQGERASVKTLGRWDVREIKTDPKGGVFVATNTSQEGFIDTITSGFAYRPNASGTPFGAARYELRRIEGDWYVFRASDDWY